MSSELTDHQIMWMEWKNTAAGSIMLMAVRLNRLPNALYWRLRNYYADARLGHDGSMGCLWEIALNLLYVEQVGPATRETLREVLIEANSPGGLKSKAVLQQIRRDEIAAISEAKQWGGDGG